jgi:hypothetical protein
MTTQPKIGKLQFYLRLTYRNFRDVVKATVTIEGPLGFYVGAYPFYFKMLTMCFLTSWFQNQALWYWKTNAGLQEWQI